MKFRSERIVPRLECNSPKGFSANWNRVSCPLFSACGAAGRFPPPHLHPGKHGHQAMIEPLRVEPQSFQRRLLLPLARTARLAFPCPADLDAVGFRRATPPGTGIGKARARAVVLEEGMGSVEALRRPPDVARIGAPRCRCRQDGKNGGKPNKSMRSVPPPFESLHPKLLIVLDLQGYFETLVSKVPENRPFVDPLPPRFSRRPTHRPSGCGRRGHSPDREPHGYDDRRRHDRLRDTGSFDSNRGIRARPAIGRLLAPSTQVIPNRIAGAKGETTPRLLRASQGQFAEKSHSYRTIPHQSGQDASESPAFTLRFHRSGVRSPHPSRLGR